MNLCKLFAVALLTAGLMPPPARASGFELWHTEAQQIQVSRKITLALQQTFRFNDDGTLYHQEYDFGFRKDLSQNWDWGLNYRLVYVKNDAEELEEESRPQFLINWKHDHASYSIQDRNILEYRAHDHKPDSWRYRNKFTLSGLYFHGGHILFRPYAADEIFVDMTDWGFVRNRFYAGVYADIFKALTAEIYYLRQSTKIGSVWTQTNVAGSSIKLSF